MLRVSRTSGGCRGSTDRLALFEQGLDVLGLLLELVDVFLHLLHLLLSLCAFTYVQTIKRVRTTVVTRI
jgi:hypothetical protein